MKNTFTREEISHLLLALVMFSNANNNQGLYAIAKGSLTFGEIAEHLLLVADQIDLNNGKSIISIVQQLRIK